MTVTTKKYIAYQTLPRTGVRCSVCKKGRLEPAQGNFGAIYKCTNTQGCHFFVDSRPTRKKCRFVRDGKMCGAIILEGTKTIPNRCSDRTCPNRNPHKLVVR